MAMDLFYQNKPGVDILAIGAHPDDLEHSIGGSILLWRAAGYSVQLVHLTDGSAGTHGSGTLRRQEATEAARLLDCPVRFLDFEDTKIENNAANRQKMIELIREYRPRVVVCQYYNYPHMHPDHEQAGQMIRHIIRLTKMKGVKSGDNQAPFPIRRVYYYTLPPELKPSFVMDISPVYDQFMLVARAYESQVGGLSGYLDNVLARKMQWRGIHGIEWGEPFYSDLPLVGNALDLRES